MTKGYVCVECGSQVVGHSKSDCDAGRAAMLFENWWDEEGRYLDPDTAEVSWFDKRKELAGFAYTAAALMRRIDAKNDEILQREREALERPLLAEIDALRVKVEFLQKRVAYWRKHAYGIHNESCAKSCMDAIEAGQP